MNRSVTIACIAAVLLGGMSPAYARRNSSRRVRIGNAAKPMKGGTATQGAPTVAALPAASPSTTAPANASLRSILTLNASGLITALDVSKGTLDVAGKTYTVGNSVVITVRGMEASWGDASIKTGAKATVSYTADGAGDVLFVTKIAITS